ncbi:hypothetical protein [Ornithinimicrobium tianjinense]|uniref:hypothetical protein n=1 Tax=Ornithinimicrobium tianjinense TaxID=1195761 RepID=UPI00166CE839|nr:hypothetical protein [Ornithinimicrobium tianjinense]
MVRPAELSEGLGSEAARARLDPYRFVAAAVLVQLARHHDLRGLYGVTSWTSLGLHCTATIDHKDRTQEGEAKALLTLALHHQPDNLPAQLALERLLHRKATTDEELRSFGDWLRTFIGRLEDRGLGATPLALRAHYLLVTSIINRTFGTCPGQDLGLGVAVTTFGKAVGKARAQPQAANDEVTAFIDQMDAKVAWVSDAYLGSGPRVLDESTPAAAYSSACYVASREEMDTHEAVRLLRGADRHPEYADWRAKDPQLARLRAQGAYRTAFLDAARDSVVDLPIFRPHRERLSGLGFTTTTDVDRFRGREPDLARLLGADPAEARRLTDAAALAVSAHEALQPHAVEVVHELVEKGVLDSSAARAAVRTHADAVAASIVMVLTDRLAVVPDDLRTKLGAWLRGI